MKWKRLDLWEAFNRTAAAGKKWLGENTQQYRPTQRRRDPDWQCEKSGHDFVNGVCSRCSDPEVDEVAAVECDFCRVIFEHTGEQHCPMHEVSMPSIEAPTQSPQLLLPSETLPELREMPIMTPEALFTETRTLFPM